LPLTCSNDSVDRNLNALLNASRVSNQQIVGDAKDFDPKCQEFHVALIIIFTYPKRIMMLAIDFNGDPELGTVEIEDVSSDGELPAKLVA
jgi:hypothetical protein